MDYLKSERGQAMPAETIRLTENAFEDNGNTAVYWLGEAGVFINSHGTTVMIDPIISTMPASIVPGSGFVSEVNGRKLLRVPPIEAYEVKKLDAVLFTHSDDDHLGVITAPMLRTSGCAYHATAESAARLQKRGIAPERIAAHPRQDVFQIGCLKIEMTPANHPWQTSVPDVFGGWAFGLEDCSGYMIHTPDGSIWIPGDGLPMPEHRAYEGIDLIFADFSDDPFHYGAQNTLNLCNHYRNADLIAYHWGTLDWPDFLPQNANPYAFRDKIVVPERLHILAQGEPYILKKI